MKKNLMTLSRRDMVLGIAAGVPLAALLSGPALAQAAGKGPARLSIDIPSGRKVFGFLAIPKKVPAPMIMVVHEWWGLNDHIVSVAGRLAKEGYLALAVDLYDGKVATVSKDARAYMGQVKAAEGTETVAAWIKWMKAHPKGTGRVATLGYCFGGGWSLNASIAEPVDATVVYYGNVNKTADQLSALKGPVLGHFSNLDRRINHQMVALFEREMKKAGKTYTSHWYDASHAFFNDQGQRYHAPSAKLSWERTLEFFKKNLG